jgi:glutathione synthase/RimK-type ligase-like ATP-grasp enzyme
VSDPDDKRSRMPLGREVYEAALKDAESSLLRSPWCVPSMFARARALDGLGDSEAATQAYFAVLSVDPSHFDTLISLGALAIRMGQRNTAKKMLEHATEAYPDHPIGHANLALVLCDEGDLVRAREHFETALRLQPANRTAHRGLAILFLWLQEPEAAQRHAQEGFCGKADVWPYRGEGRPVSLLLILSAVGSNVPLEPAIDDKVFQKWTLAAEFFDPKADLPPHDVVFNSVGDADNCGAALTAVTEILARTSVRVLNHPRRVGNTGRAENARRLGQIPGVVTPRTEAWPRDALLASGGAGALTRAGFTWPLLLRSPGFHAGQNFVKVEAPEDLQSAAANLPGASLFVIQFLDTRSQDGKIRKYRVMMVDGRLYPLHVAVSASWKVHYFSADMADRPEHRAEDEAFLTDMPRVLGPRAMQALERIREILGLDYGGIDFALDGQGAVVVFEANSTMVILQPDQGERWMYRVAPVRRVRDAVHRMLLAAARGTPAPK